MSFTFDGVEFRTAGQVIMQLKGTALDFPNSAPAAFEFIEAWFQECDKENPGQGWDTLIGNFYYIVGNSTDEEKERLLHTFYFLRFVESAYSEAIKLAEEVTV